MESNSKQETLILVFVIGAMTFAAIANLYFHFNPVEGFEVAKGERGLSWIVVSVVSLALSTYFMIQSATIFGKLFWASGIAFSLSRFIVVFAVPLEIERLVFGLCMGLLAAWNVAIWVMAARVGQNVFTFHRAKGT